MFGPTPAGPVNPQLFSTPIARAPDHFYIAGVTRNASGAPLGGCWVKLYPSANDAEVQTTTSDASGNYQFVVPDNIARYYVDAYLPGSPDVAGTTVNTLIGI
jgi:hypothetical protein